MNKNVLIILTNGFEPDLRTFKEAKYLVERGFRVRILCWDRENRHLDKKTEILDGIQIKRFFPYAQYGTGLKQIVPYFRFIVESRRYVRSLKGKWYCHCADLDGMITGMFSCPRKRMKLVFDMREFYESGSLVRFRYLIRILVRLLQNRCYKVIYLNDLQKKYVSEKNIGKLVYLPNYPEKNKFQNINKTSSEKIRVSFIGYVRHEKQLKALIDAADRFRDTVDIYIHGRGVCCETLREYAKNHSNCVITGDFNHDEIENLYNHTDLLYCVYDVRDDNDRNAYPTKFFESIITKTPMIVASDTVIARFCEDKQIGFSLGTDYEKGLIEIFDTITKERDILKQMAENEAEMQNEYLWEQVVTNLDDIYI